MYFSSYNKMHLKKLSPKFWPTVCFKSLQLIIFQNHRIHCLGNDLLFLVSSLSFLNIQCRNFVNFPPNSLIGWCVFRYSTRWFEQSAAYNPSHASFYTWHPIRLQHQDNLAAVTIDGSQMPLSLRVCQMLHFIAQITLKTFVQQRHNAATYLSTILTLFRGNQTVN